jgi:hypothetical protein
MLLLSQETEVKPCDVRPCPGGKSGHVLLASGKGEIELEYETIQTGVERRRWLHDKAVHASS